MGERTKYLVWGNNRSSILAIFKNFGLTTFFVVQFHEIQEHYLIKIDLFIIFANKNIFREIAQHTYLVIPEKTASISIFKEK